MGKALFDSGTASRLNAFTFDPDDLVLITDKKDPLYDVRVELPLKPEFVANVKAVGIIEPVVVRRVEDRAVVIDGRQRVKAARAINKEAGEQLIKVPAVVRKGDAADAYTVTVSANAHRQDDEKRDMMEKAQRLSQLGRSNGDIAMAFGVSVATVSRWLNTEPSKKAPRKPRGKSLKPKAKEVAEFVAQFKNKDIEKKRNLSEREQALLDWFIGAIPRAALEEYFARG